MLNHGGHEGNAYMQNILLELCLVLKPMDLKAKFLLSLSFIEIVPSLREHL